MNTFLLNIFIQIVKGMLEHAENVKKEKERDTPGDYHKY